MPGNGFVQTPPHLGNQWSEDHFLRSLLCRLLPPDTLQAIGPDLERFGWGVASHIKLLGRAAEAQPPRLQKHDAWGERLDLVLTADAWKQLKALSAEEGLVAAAYERQHGSSSRIYQMAKLYLFGASSGLFNCPLAMTDGAARLYQLVLSGAGTYVGSLQQDKAASSQAKDQAQLAAELQEAFQHLTSRNPAHFWTSGQWMTEKAGGSDVSSATQTTAVPEPGSTGGVGSWFRLTGYKWFTSAADGEMSMALAREQDGHAFQDSVRGLRGGSGGLTLFYVPVRRDEQGRPEGFEVVRLKEKLGTRQLPTAELRLCGMRALKVSERGRGVAAIAAMVNVTRLHNAAAACSYMRRITALAQDYARRRVAFKRPLVSQPLALRTLASMELRCCASLAFTLEVALLGLQETGQASHADSAMLRLLTPLAKLFTAKEAVAVCSKGLEFFGGNGYCEDSHIPVILRDVQVLPIWEGTTDVLSLDMLRVLSSGCSSGSTSAKLHTGSDTGGSMQECNAHTRPAAVFFSECKRCISASNAAVEAASTSRRPPGGSSLGLAVHAELLSRAAALLEQELHQLQLKVEAVAGAGPSSDAAQAVARDLAMAMSTLFVGVLLLEHAAWSWDFRHILLATEWCFQVLLQQPGSQPAAAAPFLHGDGQLYPDDSSTPAGLLEAAGAQVKVAQVLAGALNDLPQPRAKY